MLLFSRKISCKINIITSGSGAITTTVGGSQPANAALTLPRGVWLDPSKNVVFGENTGNRVCILTKDSNYQTVFLLASSIALTSGITGDNLGRLYVGSDSTYNLHLLTPPPSAAATSAPSSVPTQVPSVVPSSAPSSAPTQVPSAVPSSAPSSAPTQVPSEVPSTTPSSTPVANENGGETSSTCCQPVKPVNSTTHTIEWNKDGDWTQKLVTVVVQQQQN